MQCISSDSLRPPERPVGKPLRITVNDVFKGTGGLCVSGRVETGMVQGKSIVQYNIYKLGG